MKVSMSHRTVWTDYLAWTMKFFMYFIHEIMPQVLLKKKKHGKRSLHFIYENAHMKYRILYISHLKSGSTLYTLELTYSLYHIQNSLLTIPTWTMEIYVHHILKTVPTWNLGFCIFQISKYLQWYYYIKYGIVYISHLKISLWLF